MLSALRKFAGGWVAMIFIGLLVLSFALFGINDIFTGGANTALATVGERTVTPEAYRAALQRRTNELSRNFGTTLSLEQIRALGIPQQTVDQLINEAALDERATIYGLSRSDEALATEIVDGPAFRNVSGQFDRNLFNQILRSNGLNEATYIALEKQVSGRSQLTYPIRADIPSPAPLDSALERYRLEQRTIRVLDVTASDIEPVGTPDDAVLTAYFAENADRFRAPEYRSFDYIKIEPEDLADTIDVSEDDLAGEYESRRAAFTTEERRSVRRIAFPSRDEADAAAARIADGATFDDIVSDRGLSAADVSLGTVAQGDLIDPAIAEAAFALEVGAVSEPVDGTFGAALVTVDTIEAGSVQPLDEVRDQLRQDIALRLARQTILDSYDAIEDGRAAGETLREIADRLGLELVSVEAIDRTGVAKAGSTAELPSAQTVLPAVFEAETDFEPDPIQTREGYLFFHVTDIESDRERTLDEVRSDVVAAWIEAETAGAMSALAREITEEVSGGTRMTDVASARGLTVRDLGPFDRSGNALPQAATRQVFTTPLGGTASAVAANGSDRIVFQVLDAAIPDAGDDVPPEVGLGEDLLAQYIDAVRDIVGVETNEAALRATLGEG